MALLDDLATYLVAQGVGVAGSTADWIVAKGWLPPKPDKVIGLFETGGRPNEGHADATIDRPTFQVRTRGSALAYSTARAKLASARTSLENIGNETMGAGTRYYAHVQADAEALSLGLDEATRPHLAMNFTALRSRTT